MALLTSVESEKRRKVKHANEATQFTTVDASALPAGCFGGHLAPWMLLQGGTWLPWMKEQKRRKNPGRLSQKTHHAWVPGLKELGNMARWFKRSLAHLSPRKPCVGSAHWDPWTWPRSQASTPLMSHGKGASWEDSARPDSPSPQGVMNTVSKGKWDALSSQSHKHLASSSLRHLLDNGVIYLLQVFPL